jgi:hypothetical protein
MRINGEWRQCDDGIARPMVRGEIRAADGSWRPAEFLVDTGRPVLFSGQFAAVLELEALDISVLGRDITGLFAVIVDQPSGTVCLVRERHRYVIEET